MKIVSTAVLMIRMTTGEMRTPTRRRRKPSRAVRADRRAPHHVAVVEADMHAFTIVLTPSSTTGSARRRARVRLHPGPGTAS